MPIPSSPQLLSDKYLNVNGNSAIPESEDSPLSKCFVVHSYDSKEDANKARQELLNRGLLALFWAKLRDLANNHNENKGYPGQGEQAAHEALSPFKRTFVGAMQTASTLKDYIAKKALLCADLSGTSLDTMNFTNADLRHSNLNNCKFDDSTLTNANLEDADLQNANLMNIADFSGVNLRSAQLSGAQYKHADIMKATDLYLTNFAILPTSYNGNPAERQALENKVRESYEKAVDSKGIKIYNPVFLKLIQASGFSPLNWGDLFYSFQIVYDEWSKHDGDLSNVVTKMKRQVSEMVDPNNSTGYEKNRGVIKDLFFKKNASRAEQITGLTTLKDQQNLTLAAIADKLLEVSNAIRLEPNKLPSELQSQIEQICTARREGETTLTL
jgi:hypothetical protein